MQHLHIVITAEGRRDADHGERNPFTTVCGDVCKPCNTGWMHELEESCKGVLGKLIQGGSRNLGYWRQALAATWAAKTAMVWESVSPKDRTIPLEVLHTFHRTQRLSLRQQVWTGRYVGNQPDHSFRRTAAHVIGAVKGASENPQDAHAYAVALSVGQLAFVVFGHLLSVPIQLTVPEEGSKLVPIWPPEREVVAWPPSDALDDAAITNVLTSLGLPIPGTEGEPLP
ncbi:MAG TPA: hypothetical protein VMD09_10090 [Solirubrobacteraceae bacterium]|nr:hypothetical protein [Solirubrobacteraceae bacterium]